METWWDDGKHTEGYLSGVRSRVMEVPVDVYMSGDSSVSSSIGGAPDTDSESSYESAEADRSQVSVDSSRIYEGSEVTIAST